jgi:hypothetical protein
VGASPRPCASRLSQVPETTGRDRNFVLRTLGAPVPTRLSQSTLIEGGTFSSRGDRGRSGTTHRCLSGSNGRQCGSAPHVGRRIGSNWGQIRRVQREYVTVTGVILDEHNHAILRHLVDACRPHRHRLPCKVPLRRRCLDQLHPALWRERRALASSPGRRCFQHPSTIRRCVFRCRLGGTT